MVNIFLEMDLGVNGLQLVPKDCEYCYRNITHKQIGRGLKNENWENSTKSSQPIKDALSNVFQLNENMNLNHQIITL